MVLSLPDKWVWDSWYVRDGDLWHAFFLQADKSLGDPELRHWNVSYGHATSTDLVNWDHLGTCFAPTEGPAWDDKTTWTGSIVQDGDGLWHLFYTGTSKAEDGLRQRIGHAVSQNLHDWERVGDGLVLDLGGTYQEYRPGHWHDRAFRDPWVMPDPEGEGWLMYFTARSATVEDRLGAGAIGLATSTDLYQWELQEPTFIGAAGQLEVPQVFQAGQHWYCLFCTDTDHWTDEAKRTLGQPGTGTHYLIGDSPRGPWRLAPGPMLDGDNPVDRYAARVVENGDGLKLMGFRWFDRSGSHFIGEIADPAPIRIAEDGRLMLADAA